MHPIAILCNVLTCMQTCRRNKPVLQCETNPLRKPTTNTENMRSCTQRCLVVHRRSVRSVYYISKCSCNMKEWLFSTSNLKTLVPFWNCMDKNCPTPCRIPWNLVILSYSEWSFFFKWSDPKASFCFVYENWNLNVATIRAHLLHPYEDSYYPNYAMVKVPSNLCHVKRGCVCNLQHTQLFEYKRLLVICTATTEGGMLVSTMKHLPLLDAPDYKVFTFLDKYKMSSLKEYKSKRVDLHAPCLM